MVVGYFPGIITADRVPGIEGFVASAYEAANLDYNIEKAVEWGNGFSFPPETHSRDADELIALDYDLTELARRRQAALQPGRLNLDRLTGRDPSHPDTRRLRDLAEFGVQIPLA